MNINTYSAVEIYDAAMDHAADNKPTVALAEAVILDVIQRSQPELVQHWRGKSASESVDAMDKLNSAMLMNIVAAAVINPMTMLEEALRIKIIERLEKGDE